MQRKPGPQWSPDDHSCTNEDVTGSFDSPAAPFQPFLLRLLGHTLLGTDLLPRFVFDDGPLTCGKIARNTLFPMNFVRESGLEPAADLRSAKDVAGSARDSRSARMSRAVCLS